MAAPTPSDIRTVYGVETDLSDSALQTVIDSEWAALLDSTGYDDASDTVSEIRFPVDETDILLGEDAASITSVVEAGVTLTTDNYVLVGTRTLRRGYYGDPDAYWAAAHGGTYWGRPVTVTYVPRNAQTRSRLILTLVQLIKLWLAYSGNASTQTPDITERPLDYTTERDKLLNSVALETWII